MAIRFCINLYRQKAAELEKQFTNETILLINKYSNFRGQLTQRNKELESILKTMAQQENIIIELRQFIQEHRLAIEIINQQLYFAGFNP